MNDKINILVIDHPSKGCSNNLLALAQVLTHDIKASEIEVLQCRIKARILNIFVKILLNHISPKNIQLGKFWWKLLFKGNLPKRKSYDFVLSYLGPGESPNVYLNHFLKGISIHVGTPRRMPKKLFHIVIANIGVPPKRGEMSFEIPPSRFSHSKQSLDIIKWKKNLPASTVYAALLIGGPATGASFNDQYWTDIFELINKKSSAENIKWLISTSPRTPAHINKKLLEIYKENKVNISHINIYNETADSYLEHYLSSASIAYVTAESTSMIADAMSFDIPVIAVSTKNTFTNARINNFLKYQSERTYISVQTPENLISHHSVIKTIESYTPRPQWSDLFLKELSKRTLSASNINKNADIQIALIGDCNTGGLSNATLDNIGNTFSSFLINKKITPNIYNYGQAMFSTREGVNISKTITNKIDILMINFGLADSWVTTLPSIYIPYYPDSLARKYLRKLLKSIKKRIRGPFFSTFLPRDRVVPITEYIENINTMIKNVRLHSPNVKVVLWGIAPIPRNTIKENLARSYDHALKDLAKSSGATYIDTCSLLKGYDADLLYFDGLHINSTAQKLIIQDVYDKIFPL